MERKGSKAENELWYCVSSGNGMHCPLYSDCDFRKGGWCLDDNLEFVSSRFEEIAQVRDKVFTPDDFDFLTFRHPCYMLRLVECLAESYLQKGGINCPPVPTSLAMLADEMCNIEVRLIPLKMCHGGLWRLNSRWVVHLSSNDNPTWQRFTLFHEVFHILAHRKTTPVFSKIGSEEGRFNEALANYFANYVLAPPHWVKQAWAKSKDIAQMAAYFDVPYVVMFVMLRRAGLVVLLLSLLILLALETLFCRLI